MPEFLMNRRDQLVLLFICTSVAILIYSIVYMEPSNTTPHKKNDKPTVAIIGGGLAGLSAALEAADNGAKVFLLEKESR